MLNFRLGMRFQRHWLSWYSQRDWCVRLTPRWWRLRHRLNQSVARATSDLWRRAEVYSLQSRWQRPTFWGPTGVAIWRRRTWSLSWRVLGRRRVTVCWRPDVCARLSPPRSHPG